MATFYTVAYGNLSKSSKAYFDDLEKAKKFSHRVKGDNPKTHTLKNADYIYWYRLNCEYTNAFIVRKDEEK